MTSMLKFSIVCAFAVISVKRIESQTVTLTATPAQVKPSASLSLRCILTENIPITGVRFYRNDVWMLFITPTSSSCNYIPLGADDGNNYTYKCDPTDRWYQVTVDSVRETEHGVIWRCEMSSSTAGPGSCGTLNGVNPCTSQDVTVTVIGEVKNVEITSEDGTTITSPVVISASNTNTKLLCTTGTSGSRPEAQLSWLRTGTPNQQINSGLVALPGQSLDQGYVVSKSTLNIANISYNGISIFCQASLAGEETNSGQVTLNVRFKPDIDIRVAGVVYTTYTITENQLNVQFTCNIIANPTTGITYSWLRDGQTIPGVIGQIYRITQVQKADRGILTCTAANTEGTTISAGVNIDVQYQAAITVMQDVTMEEGTTLTQVCTANGNPQPSFRWTFGGIDVSSSETLQRNSITSQQNGTYTCHANNTLTATGQTAMSRETIATLHVTVYFGPKNVVPSQTHVNITKGQSDSSVSCTATCNPACTYRWLKNGSPVNTGSMLQLMSVSKSQAGNYYCEASNTFLNKTKTRVSALAVIVNVMFSPEVQLTPQQDIQPTPDPYTILLGQNNVGLRCGVVASNPQPSSYTWSVNNSVIEGAVQETYTIVMVSLQTAGTYKCRGNNGIADPANSSLDLDVQYGPVIDPIINQTKGEGMSLSVPCRYTSNPPTNQVSWTKVRNNTFSQNQNSLTISPLDRSDRGIYRCNVTNTLLLSGKPNGQQRTARMDFYLVVHYQPSITSLYVEGNSNVVSENDTVKIVCKTDSNPTSTFTWTRQSDLASLPELGNMLTLSSVQCSDTTFFTCTANNNIGPAATKNVQLFVQCQPRIDSIAPQETAYGAVGESINITVQHIIAFPPPKFLWEKNNDTLPTSNQTDTNTSSTLTVRRLDVHDFGSYSVTIDNTIGKPFVFYIEVESASHPLKPTDVTVTASTTHSITLSWTSGFNGGAAQNFSIQYRRDGGSDFSNYSKTFPDENSQPMTATVDGLEEGTVYFFRLIAINRFGESPVTEEKSTTTDKSPPASSNLGAIIGGAAGGGFAIVLIAGIAVFLFRRKRSNTGTKERRTADEDRDQLEFEDVNTPNSLYQSAGPSNETYAQVDLKKKKTMDVQPEGDLYAVVNKSKPNNSGAENTVYEYPGLLINEIPKTENGVYANQPAVPKRRNQDGLIYIDLDLGPTKNVKGKAVIHGLDDATEYAEVAFGKKGPPPPDLDD